MGKPQAKVLAEHLEKFRLQPVGGQLGASGMGSSAAGLGNEFTVGGGWDGGQLSSLEAASAGPRWLRMGYSAGKALAKFVGTGMKRVPRDVYQQRLRTCAGCDHHTGLRCKLCGCFTGVKARLPREECPVRKWSASE